MSTSNKSGLDTKVSFIPLVPIYAYRSSVIRAVFFFFSLAFARLGRYI